MSGGSRGAVLDLQFISMNPASQAEKQRNRKIIRSTAMRSFRQKQSSRGAPSKSTTSSQTTTVPLQFELFPKSRGSYQADSQDWSANGFSGKEDSFSENSWLPLSPPSESSSKDGSGGKALALSESRPRTNGSGASRTNSMVLGSPVTPLGAGRVDPFRVYTVDLGGQIPELIDHCKYCPVLVRKRALKSS